MIYEILGNSFDSNGIELKNKKEIITVNGRLASEKAGFTLPHEHLLVDFTGADHYDPLKWDRKQVIDAVKPFLDEIKLMGCSTFVDCTPEYLGRDPEMLKNLSDLTGLNIMTNTGYYGAQKNKFLPHSVFSQSEEAIAEIWIKEFNMVIGSSGIRPGFIKMVLIMMNSHLFI